MSWCERQVSGMAAGPWVMMFPDSPATGRLAGVAAAVNAAGSSSAPGRIALVAITVAAVGAFTVLQFRARSRRRRSLGELDWRTFPPRYEAEPGDSGRTGDDEALFGSQESYGPRWGYWSPPGYRGSPLPPWEGR